MRFRSASLFLLLCALCRLYGQTSGGVFMISGTVTDQSGASIPGAVVAARQRGKSAERKTTTDAAGSFQLSGVPAGAFDLEVTSQGFTTATIPVTVAGRSP